MYIIGFKITLDKPQQTTFGFKNLKYDSKKEYAKLLTSKLFCGRFHFGKNVLENSLCKWFLVYLYTYPESHSTKTFIHVGEQ